MVLGNSHLYAGVWPCASQDIWVIQLPSKFGPAAATSGNMSAADRSAIRISVSLFMRPAYEVINECGKAKSKNPVATSQYVSGGGDGIIRSNRFANAQKGSST